MLRNIADFLAPNWQHGFVIKFNFVTISCVSV